ncbi:MAG TPA: hypothetical protein VE733_29170 [Streptosporangiaceae bacterium]|jgi:hypothetical protein|nr:hypothetical protein [Streptosporangiaceae bacterium]
MTRTEDPHGEEFQARTNQRRDEPLPASHHDEHDQQTVIRNEQHAAARSEEPGQHPAPVTGDGTVTDDGVGKAVRDMMPGPAPQGDVPDAPATQVATAQDPADSGERPGPVRQVSNAVPGKPDGEVDTRP